MGVLHGTFEVWGGAEWFLHGLLASFAKDERFDVVLYTHRFVPPPGGSVSYTVVEHRLGGVRSGPWDWARIARRYGPRWPRHDVLWAHNHPALEWAVRAKGAPPLVWYCHEPPRHVWGLAPAGTPDARDRAPAFSLARALSTYGSRLPWRAWSRMRLALATRTRGEFRWREKLQQWDRQAVGRCARVLANSRFTAWRVGEIYGHQADVVYPLSPEFDPSAELPRTAKERMVLWVGRLTHAKRPLEMLAAWERLGREGGSAGYRLVMVGDGPLRLQLDEAIAPLRAAGLAELRAQVPREELRELYRRALLTVHLGEDEPFGLVPLESMWEGTPVLGLCEGGVAETVLPGKTGWCLPDSNENTLARELARLLANPESLERMGASAATTVRSRFSFRDTWRLVCEALDEASGRGRAGAEERDPRAGCTRG